MSALAPEDEARCRELAEFALGKRTRATQFRDEVDAALLEIVQLAESDVGWKIRVEAERAHHLSRRHGLGTKSGVAAADLALRLSTGYGDPVLRALATHERYRLNPTPNDRCPVLLLAVNDLAWVMEQAAAPTNTWGAPAGQVYGMAVCGLATALRAEGRFDERLEWLQRCRSNPRTSEYYAADCFRLAEATLSKLLRFDALNDLREELNAAVDRLGDEGRTMMVWLDARVAERQGRWGDAAAGYAAAFELSTSNATRGGLANKAAYAFCQLGDGAHAKHWAQRALESWDSLSSAGSSTTKRVMSARYLAWAHFLSEDWAAGLTAYASLIIGLYPRPAPATWVSLAERLVAASASGVDFSSLPQIDAPTEAGNVDLADPAAVAFWAVKVAHHDGLVTEIRARSTLAELALLGFAPVAEIDAEQLVRDGGWLAERRRWWRAGKMLMLAAHCFARTDRSERAAEVAANAVEHWQQYRGAADVLDQHWMLGNEVDNYFFAWQLAIDVEQPEFAARVAEALRGTAISALLASIESIADLQAQASAIAEDLESDLAQPDVVSSESSEDVEPGADGDGDGEAEFGRDSRRTALEYSATQVATDLAFLKTIMPAPGELASLEPSVGCRVWVDVHEGELFAASSSAGAHRALHSALSNNTQNWLRLLSNPHNAQAVDVRVIHRGCVQVIPRLVPVDL